MSSELPPTYYFTNITFNPSFYSSGSDNLTNEEVADVNFIVLPTQSYNLGTTFSGSFNNVSGDNGSNCYIWYYTPDALFGPPIVLFYQSLYTTEEVPFNFTYGSIVSGSKIEFYCDSTTTSVLLNAYVTGSWLEATNIPYEVEDLLITGSSIQMYTITGSSGGSIVDTEILTFSTSSFSLSTGNSITFNLSSSGAERVLCKISSSAEDVFNAVVTLSNQGTTVYSNSDPKLNYTLNETFNISSGYLTISNTSDAATLTISGLEVYQQPSYYQTVETVYGLNQVLIPNEFDFNGELQGSEILVTDGDLNGGNPFLTFPTQEYKYDIQVQLLVSSSPPFTLQEWFEFSVSSGQIKLLADQSGDTDLGLIYAKISKTSLNGLDTTSTLEDLQDFRIDILSPTGTYETHTVISIQEQVNYFLYTLVPDGITYTSTTYLDRLVVFSPVDNTAFINSNYDVLVNNAGAARFNDEFFDVDFSTNAITAVNRVNVISASRGTGSATPSTTPASNYTTARIANPRYNGSKTNSINYNIYTPPTTFTDSSTSIFGYSEYWPGDQAFGKQTSIDVYSNYFAKFINITSSSPELPGTSKIYITELIDTKGNIYVLGQNQFTLDVAYNFYTGTTVGIYNIIGFSASFAASSSVIDGGAYYQTILYSTGSTGASGSSIPTFATYVTGQSGGKTNIDGLNEYYSSFTSSAPNVLSSVNSNNPTVLKNWLYGFLTSSFSDTPLSQVSVLGEFAGIYNTNTNTVINGSNPSTFSRTFVNFSDIITPIQTNDYIRIGTTSSLFFTNNPVTSSQTFQITNAYIDPSGDGLDTGSLTLNGNISNLPSSLGQAYIIYRRVPSDSYIIIDKEINSNSTGLIIPFNFNPAYDPIKIARDIKII